MEGDSPSPKTTDVEGATPIERRSILLRGYVETDAPPARERRWWSQPASRFALFFDTETNPDAAQRLRFGCYQLCERERRRESGIFYDPGNAKPSELDELRRVSRARGHRLMTAEDFVDRIFYPSAKAGATIVGFNLPFDISRLAIGHEPARAVRRKNGTVDRSMQGGFKQAGDDEAERLDAEQLALKILANATSYGIFIEINVEDLDEREPRTAHGADGSFQSSSDKREEPGKYFHPLLATLITGAARLMLAISERLALDHGLDWAFCDTDSMAFTLPANTELNDTAGSFLEKQVEQICNWFEELNPYEVKGSILKLEDQNFVRNVASGSLELTPLYCYAVSAKRYALFNEGADGHPIIRKASAHGLGHLYPPYTNRASLKN